MASETADPEIEEFRFKLAESIDYDDWPKRSGLYPCLLYEHLQLLLLNSSIKKIKL